MERTGTLLRCIDCGVESDWLATGWQAYLLSAVEGEFETEVLTFCPDCVEREFDPSGWNE
jgi:hypothetical protein